MKHILIYSVLNKGVGVVWLLGVYSVPAEGSNALTVASTLSWRIQKKRGQNPQQLL